MLDDVVILLRNNFVLMILWFVGRDLLDLLSGGIGMLCVVLSLSVHILRLGKTGNSSASFLNPLHRYLIPVLNLRVSMTFI